MSLALVAYLGTFNTNDLSAGYLGDIGQSAAPYPPFSFQVPAGSNFVVVVMSHTNNLVCNSYTLNSLACRVHRRRWQSKRRPPLQK